MSEGYRAKLFTSEAIASAWVSQTHRDGRCSSSMSFTGTRFYSYSTVIAEVITHHGKTAFLVNSGYFSDTTSRHVNLVRCAIGSRQRFEVPQRSSGDYRSFSDLRRILHGYQSEALILLLDSGKAREPKKTRLILEAYQVVVTMRGFAAYFGLSLDGYAVTLPLTEAEIKAIIREREAQDKIRQAEAEERVKLGKVMRRLEPHKEISTREVYQTYRKAKRNTQ